MCRIVALTALAAFGFACGPAGPSGPLGEAQARLNDARRTWRAQSVNSYSFVYARFCLCVPDALEPVRIVVRGQRVESVVTVSTGASRSPAEFRTIDGLFDMIQGAIDDGVASVVAEYDPRLGFPRTVYIDVDARLADEEVAFEARDLVPIG